MAEPDEQSGFATCSCQNCGGHIKFDASQFRKGETRNVECPHCHMDTVIFVRQGQAETSRTAKDASFRQSLSLNEQSGPTTRFELFVLRLTRTLALIGAALVIGALAVTAIAFFWTLLPNVERSHKIISVSYEEIAAAIQPPPQRPVPPAYSGSRINTTETVPALVANFVVSHPDIKLDTSWMGADLRRAFLSNLSTILQTAKAKHVPDAQRVQFVKAYVELWATENTPQPEPKPLFSKAQIRLFCIGTAASLFIAITVLCLILVLLAIERNIRLIAEKPASSAIRTESTPTAP